MYGANRSRLSAPSCENANEIDIRNGKTPGISQPSVAGQAEVIRKAYRKAGLDTGETSYVECHGTGTALGDPIEVEALSQIFLRSRRHPLLLGAVCTMPCIVLRLHCAYLSLRSKQTWAIARQRAGSLLSSRPALLSSMQGYPPQLA